MATLAEMTEQQLADLIGKQVAEAVAHARGEAGAGDTSTTTKNIIEMIAAMSAAKGGGVGPSNIFDADGRPMQKGELLGRIVRCVAAGRGSLEKSVAYATKHYGEKSHAVKALSAGVGEDGGFLVRDEVANEVIELLRDRSVVREGGASVLTMGTGTFSIPKITGGATAVWVGENDPISTTAVTFGQIRMTFKKLAAIVPISNDLIRFSSPGADQFVRNDLTKALALTSDLAFLRGTGTEHSPRGMRSFASAASNIISAQSSYTLAKVTYDLGRMLLQLLEANVWSTNLCWFMTPRTAIYLMTVRDGNGNFAFNPEMMTGKLWGYPFKLTNQIPINLGSGDKTEITLCNMDDAIIGESLNMVIDASQEAAYYDGTQVQAAFSNDQTVVRCIEEVDFTMRHNESVVVMDSVDWAPTA